MTQTRLKPEVRREEILASALSLAAVRGYVNITQECIADSAGLSASAIHYHFGTMDRLRCELMQYAVRVGNAVVVAQGLVARDKYAMRADDQLKKEAMDAILEGWSK